MSAILTQVVNCVCILRVWSNWASFGVHERVTLCIHMTIQIPLQNVNSTVTWHKARLHMYIL